MVFLIIYAFIFVFVGCKGPENAPPEQKSANPVSQYGDSMIGAYTQGKKAGETGNLDTVQKTIQAYRAINDRYPESLDEIEPMFGSAVDLSIYDYDPDTGQVSIKK